MKYFVFMYGCNEYSDDGNQMITTIVSRKWLVKHHINPDIPFQECQTTGMGLGWEHFYISLAPIGKQGEINLNDLARAFGGFTSPEKLHEAVLERDEEYPEDNFRLVWNDKPQPVGYCPYHGDHN